MIMTDEQKTILDKLENNFDVLWSEFCQFIPEAKEIITRREIAKFGKKFGKKYAKRYKLLLDSRQELIKSSCLLDEFVSSLGNEEQNLEFCNEVKMIAETIQLALSNAKSFNRDSIVKGVNDILKQMIITLDLDIAANNPDYRNRLNELLVFNWLCECKNLKITDIAYTLDNGKDCDFRCIHKDGTELLIEVVSIQNIDLSKQDNANTFSEFINKKVEMKFTDKTRDLRDIPNLKILPILDYVNGIVEFAPTLDTAISFPAFTVVKNTIEGNNEILLTTINNLTLNRQ